MKKIIAQEVLDTITPMLPKKSVRVFVLSQKKANGKCTSEIASNLETEDLLAFLGNIVVAGYETLDLIRKHGAKKRGPGRPKGSKNEVKRGPGRPKGSKNKAKK